MKDESKNQDKPAKKNPTIIHVQTKMEVGWFTKQN